MILSIASGKGGTGKTTISTALAVAANTNVSYYDCDVEEPNGLIFLKPKFTVTNDFFTEVPRIESEQCIGCGACEKFCQFNALMRIADTTVVMDEMCHDCGGCYFVCPNEAITSAPFQIGRINKGKHLTKTGNVIKVVSGTLEIGRTMSPPLIKEVKKGIKDSRVNIIDCPPGASCPMITAVDGSDFVILVTEPTPFGLNDLKIAVDTLRKLGLPFGVIINKANIGNSDVADYCNYEQIEILTQIDSMPEIAQQYSEGKNILNEIPEIQAQLKMALQKIFFRHCGQAV
ncbi:MAG: (4Fe-4S)-binding protein [Gammaproteobacteria bacterium]|nr:MAG: (4Fe-4S)-binding protein [Gammaproteobacteria bacterium]